MLPSPVVHLLPDSDLRCFVVPGAFSPAKCAELLESAVKVGFQGAGTHYPTYYRNNERLVVDDEQLAEQLFAAIRPVLPLELPADEPAAAPWYLRMLNSRLRFCRYAAGQYFHRHLDGVHHQSATVQSRLTFMIYLNDAREFSGGRTLFYRTKDDPTVWAEYQPARGDLIVFDHRIWHEGEQLGSGEKFVLRSDILYETAPAHQPADAEPFAPGHLGYIWQVVPFGTAVVSAGRDKVIKVWDRNGQLQQQLHGHQNSVLSLCPLSATILLSGSRDTTIKVWEQQRGALALVRTLTIHAATVLAVVALTDNLFASSAADKTIKVSDVYGNVQHTLTGHTDWVWQVTPLPHGRLLSSSEDGTLRLWDWHQGLALGIISRNQPPVHALLFEPTQRLLISGDCAGCIEVRQASADYAHWTLQQRFTAHRGIVRTLAWLGNGRLASGGEDSKVKIWQLSSGHCEQEMHHNDFVQALSWVPASSQLFSASYDGKLRVWKLA
ncbi:2OG-Fe(II) oxygenase [Hymenobacter negativus]|uniref:2OG-Fe(II) oxygenase n=1 Tax=Hymenobacter negativus TaxID=2795026 RepID=A0ABS3QIX4_9BACT|nr:2OG-Fe(II) oxygenase [Hymenobacter negativus]MBO2011201.1 2OG-Fe(II) oxygenase [Hymenobacter negativus]